MDQEGHVHLSDFNIACNIPEKHEKPLISLSGTAVYFGRQRDIVAHAKIARCSYTADL